MSGFSKIGDWFQDQATLIRDFYHLDYWDNHILSEGFAEAIDGASEILEESLHDRSSFVQASAGAGIGLARLTGGIPIFLNEWALQVVNEIPEGPGATLFKFVEIPASGFVQSIGHIGNSFKSWANGSLNNQDSYSIAQEVTSVLGAAVLMGRGAKNIGKGAGKFFNGLKETASDLSFQLQANGMATAVVGTQGAIALAGGADLMSGIVFMASAEGSNDEPLPNNPNTGGSALSKSSVQDLLQRYGGEMLAESSKHKTASINFRLPKYEQSLLEQLSKKVGLERTLVFRLALKLLNEVMGGKKNESSSSLQFTKEELLNRYGGRMLTVSHSQDGSASIPVNFRLPVGEFSEAKIMATNLNLNQTMVSRLALYLLDEVLQ